MFTMTMKTEKEEEKMVTKQSIAVGVGLILVGYIALQIPYEKIPDEKKAKSPDTQGREARASSSGSLPICRLDFEVFLSFNDEDVGRNFGDFLFKALVNEGFRTFRYDEIQIGEEIVAARQSAINQSKIAIPILSKNYGCHDCLTELAEIMGRRVEGKIIVMPVFYHVSPSEVRHQDGCFATAFRYNDVNCNPNTALERRKAMRLVGELRGWVAADWVERKLIEDIVETTWKKLMKGPYIVIVKKIR